MNKRFLAYIPLLLYAFILVLGFWLRLNQFFVQVLNDDEWHAIHRLLTQTPLDIFLSFGLADHSIPLTLLYWLVSSWIGLSELGMRWPMMLSGLAILILFPWYIWRIIGQREAILFASMLAISPILIIYSQTARPYSITLLLVYIAHFSFYRYCSNIPYQLAFGILFGVTAILATWMHLIVGPLVVAPFIYEGVSIFFASGSERRSRFRRLLLLGLPTAIGMTILVLPPLLMNFEVIGNKSGVDSPDWQTIVGVWHVWFGTSSIWVVLIFLILAGMGLPRLWRELIVVRSIFLGLAITLIVILVVKPAWVHHSVTFGRYLLPAIPLLLLLVSVGTVRLADAIEQMTWPVHTVISTGVICIPPLLLALQTPLVEMLRRPNSYFTHSIFLFDFRPEHNRVQKWMRQEIPLSPYWMQLASLPRDSLQIAVAPFYFESYKWDAPRWEFISGQTIIPGYLTGLCVDSRFGEVPNIDRFRFRNAVFLSDEKSLAAHKIDLIAYQKPYIANFEDAPQTVIGKDTSDCEAALRTRFGTPQFEDNKIIVFLVDVSSQGIDSVK